MSEEASVKTPVEITPEPLAALQARYPRALEFVYDQAAVVLGGAIRPGECAENVFDFEDGLRLIVSRQRGPGGKVWLHFSASFGGADCRLADEFRLLRRTTPLPQIFEQWRLSVPGRFALLSGDAREAAYLGRSANGVPHWVIEEEPS